MEDPTTFVTFQKGTGRLPRVLTDRMVFLGGCATGLLLTDPAAPEVRPTRDVDVITEVGSLAEYYRLADALRVVGFVEDQGLGAPLQAPHLHVVEGIRGMGYSGAAVARFLGVTTSAVNRLAASDDLPQTRTYLKAF